MSNLQIREANPADCDTISKITLDAYEQYSTMEQTLWQLYKQNIVNTLADTGPAQQLVAELDGVIVGTVLLFSPGIDAYGNGEGGDGGQAPEVRLLAVTPNARGYGVGVALMQECIRRARVAGAPAIALHTADVMAAAMHLYEKMGFIRVPKRDFFPVETLHIKAYEMPLN